MQTVEPCDLAKYSFDELTWHLNKADKLKETSKIAGVQWETLRDERNAMSESFKSTSFYIDLNDKQRHKLKML